MSIRKCKFFNPSGNYSKQKKKVGDWIFNESRQCGHRHWHVLIQLVPRSDLVTFPIISIRYPANRKWEYSNLSGSSCRTWSNTKFLQPVCIEMCNKSRKGRINNQMLSEQIFFFFFATFKSDPIRQNLSSQYQYNINQISDENKEKYQFED